jgi:hypothetical protein
MRRRDPGFAVITNDEFEASLPRIGVWTAIS